MTSIAVVIVSYEVRAELGRCLRALEEAGFAAPGGEVVVVDNASTDGTAMRVREEHPWVQLVARPDNRGFSAGVNEGVRHTTARHVLLLNPDTEVPLGCLPLLRAAAERCEGAGVIGFRHVDGDGQFQLSVGLWPSLPSELLRRVVQRRLDAGDSRVRALCQHFLRQPRAIAWVSGSAMLVRRDTFEAVQGFDERYFLYFEDMDFCLRVWATGARVVFDPSLTLLHHRGRSAAKSPERAARAYRESQLRFWRTHKGAIQARLVEAYLRWSGKHPA